MDPQPFNTTPERQLIIVLQLTNVNTGAGTDNLSCFPVVHFPRIWETDNRSITKRIHNNKQESQKARKLHVNGAKFQSYLSF